MRPMMNESGSLMLNGHCGRTLRRLAWLSALALLLLASAETAMAGPESATRKDANVSAQAFSDRESIEQGGSLQLAIVLTPDKDWHVYWKNPGGMTGLPTAIEWKSASGLKFGETRFPVPKLKHDKLLKEDSYILPGESVYVTQVQAPADLAVGSEVTLSATVSWLACKKECIPGEVELSLTLPVVAKGTAAKPANEKIFKNAQYAFAEPLSAAEYVKIGHRVDKTGVKPGDTFTASIVLDIQAKHHMQSNKPASEDFIPTVLFLERTDGFEFGELVYPKAHVREDKILGKLSEFGGKVEIGIPVTVAEDAAPEAKSIRGVLQYQICNDSGTCYPPQHIEIAIPVEMAGAKASAAAPAGGAPAEPATGAAAAATGATGAAPSAAAQDPPGEDVPVAKANNNAHQGFLQRFETYLLSFGFKGAVLVALIGGFILNLMPCVLPVISLKILSFVRQSHEHRARIFWLGMAYAAGIMVFFGVLAIIFWQTNKQFQWGEQFQRPHVVIALAAVVTAFSLSLFGVWAVFTPRVINKLGEKAEGEGYTSAFSTGLLATFLGTACTAPFLSAALGAASKFSPSQGGLIFLAVGVGMAAPFVMLAANPAWLRFVPRPGPWMGTFESLMGFLLLGTVIWLVNPLRSQIGGEGLLLSLIFLLAVAIAAWIKGKIEFGAPPVRKLKLYGLSIAILVVGWVLPFRVLATIEQLTDRQIRQQELLADGELFRRAGASGETARGGAARLNLDWSGGIPWQQYRRERALADVRSGYTVFVDYTADWCANCKTMLKTAIERPEVIKVMKELDIVPYTADYTLRVPEITEDLRRFQRGGVPVFVVYRPYNTDEPEILPEIITSSILIDALRRAGPSKVAASSLVLSPR